MRLGQAHSPIASSAPASIQGLNTAAMPASYKPPASAVRSYTAEEKERWDNLFKPRVAFPRYGDIEEDRDLFEALSGLAKNALPLQPDPLPPGEVGEHVFAPEWCDPWWLNHRNLKRAQLDAEVIVPRPERDEMEAAYPALRLDQRILNPTPYAMRWGIWKGRRDGRSRFSPPGAPSRVVQDPHSTTVWPGSIFHERWVEVFRQHRKLPSQINAAEGILSERELGLLQQYEEDVEADEALQRLLMADFTTDDVS